MLSTKMTDRLPHGNDVLTELHQRVFLPVTSAKRRPWCTNGWDSKRQQQKQTAHRKSGK